MKKEWFHACVNWMGAVFLVAVAALTVTGGGPKTRETAAGPVFASSEQKAPLIVVDAGHGGADGGASGRDSGVQEQGINLAVAKLVEEELLQAGFRVVMTRENEKAIAPTKQQDMKKRKEIMGQEDVAAVVSIHMNIFEDRAIRGPMAFYMKGSAPGESLAASIIGSLCESLGHPKRLANPGDYYVLRESAAPAVIVECGFLSNPEEERLLQQPDHQKKLARGIAAGISAWFAGSAEQAPPQEVENAA